VRASCVLLQQHFANFWYLSLTWSESKMWEVINYCVIMHTMIIKSEQESLVVDNHLIMQVLLHKLIRCRSSLLLSLSRNKKSNGQIRTQLQNVLCSIRSIY
jgi:hypothetical protein